jgi:hypothetical protein
MPAQILVVLTGCISAINSRILLGLPQATLLSSAGHFLPVGCSWEPLLYDNVFIKPANYSVYC